MTTSSLPKKQMTLFIWYKPWGYNDIEFYYTLAAE